MSSSSNAGSWRDQLFSEQAVRDEERLSDGEVDPEQVKLLEDVDVAEKILQVTQYLRGMSDYDAVNEIWNSWIDPDNPPTRSCVTANMADPRSLIEIRITAARDIG